MCRTRTFLVVFLLMLMSAVSAAEADQNFYLYSEEVASYVNIGVFLNNGQIVMLDGSGGGSGSMKYVFRGPAPAPYPQVQVWERGVERLGPSPIEFDGVRFVNHGTHWVANRLALMLWTIEIPQASSRYANEFEQDLTLSLWVDWNRDERWKKNEKMIHQHINLRQYFPSTEETIRVYYLTSFRVPDVDDLILSFKKEDADRDVFNMWVRGIVSYDDPDVSPDGEQLFGDVEDYRARYMKTPRTKTVK